MVDSVPERWRVDSNRKWYPVDSLVIISDINPNGGYMLTSHDDVEVAFDPSGWVLFREPDLTSGGAFPQDRVLGITWSTP